MTSSKGSTDRLKRSFETNNIMSGHRVDMAVADVAVISGKLPRDTGTVACESALRSAGTLLSRVRAPPSAPRPDGGP
ncbi:hypothetical protein PoB_003531700 [Plakobranchus ocellatus]|uniref:Uncharacterized protein n=1 Tax=Plakobranchus ocellatus TaxID=259542 RepID=A0AAV4ANH5_9GAST|nr:hypothetical protein PoB_003531700 [Plakobranchus ocellatus]